jgi:hypothetical protein
LISTAAVSFIGSSRTKAYTRCKDPSPALLFA